MKLKKHYKRAMAIAMSVAMLAGSLWLTGDMPYVEAVEQEEFVCEHHVHDEECGYNEETKEGCTYECPECVKESDNITEEQEKEDKEIAIENIEVRMADDIRSTEDKVAQIGDTTYATLKEAIDNAVAGTTVTLLKDASVDEMIEIKNSMNIHLNGKKVINNVKNARAFNILTAGISVNVDGSVAGSGMTIPESNANSYGFIKIDAASEVTVNGGTYTGETDSGAFFKFFKNASGAVLNLNDITGESNNRFLDTDTILDKVQLTVKNVSYKTTGKAFGFDSIGASPITFEDVKVEAGTGPVIEISGGAATFTECDFKVTDTTSPSDFSRAAVAVSYEGTAVINSGTYTSSGYGVYVYSSGGKITVKEGSSVTGAVAAVKADVDSSTYQGAESIIEIQGGSIQGEMLTNNNDAASIIVSGGVFDTEVPDEYCAEGFMPAVYDAATGKYTVAAAVAEIVSGSSVQRFTSLGDALKAAQEGDTVRIVKNTEIKEGEKLTIKEGISVEVLAGANLTNNGEITVKGTLKINKGGSVTDGDNGIIDIYGTVDNDGNALDESGVKYHIKSLKFEQSEMKLVIGEKIQLKVKKTPVNAVDDIKYSVDNKDVISIDKYGNVTAIGVGKATITAKSGDVETTCTIEVTKKPEQKPDDSKTNKNGGSDKPNSGKSSAQSKSSEKKTVKTVKKADTVKTADTANIYLWGLIAIGALLVATEVILIRRRLRYRKN